MEIITLTGGKTCRYLLSWENGEKCEERHSHSCPSGDAASSCYLGKVRHSLANGAMEKGASASAPSSTSGDEIFVLPFLWDRVNPGSGSLIPGKQAKSF